MKRAVIFSVSDKTGIIPLAQAFQKAGYLILSTSGTAKLLRDAEVELELIEDYTGQKEILDGRVKTLHPKLYAGILARADLPGHLSQLSQAEIPPVDAVVVNLYPFIEARKSRPEATLEEMIELIDIGGPSLLRAAAKNHYSVIPLSDPADYLQIQELLNAQDSSFGTGATSLASSLPETERLKLAGKVFTHVAHYNLEIAKYISQVIDQESQSPAQGTGLSQIKLKTQLPGGTSGVVFSRQQELRYGENPHQKASFFRAIDTNELPFTQLQGKLLSYNNILDCDAALRVLDSFKNSLPTVAILKHLTPCGAATRSDLLSALQAAKRSDPRSHFGGVLVFNGKVSAAVASEIAEDFAEIVLAPAYSPDSLQILSKKKNLRVLKSDTELFPVSEIRAAAGGYLWQERDLQRNNPRAGKLVTDRVPFEEEFADLTLAGTLVQHVKSNAIVIVNQGTLIGSGGGQTSRIDAVELAITKARVHNHNLIGSVAASDAFFPFPDSVETLAAAGVVAIMVPGGSLRDSDVIETAKGLGISLIFTESRHFRH